MKDEITVSRRIAAPAGRIFAILADPVRHLELDGSGMLRGAVTRRPVTAVGDVFVMRMHYVERGDYEMANHVVEFEQDRRIGWEPRPDRGHLDHGLPRAGDWRHRWSYRLDPVGPDDTVVTEHYDCSRVPAAERIAMDGGRIWLTAMAETLRRLEAAARPE